MNPVNKGTALKVEDSKKNPADLADLSLQQALEDFEVANARVLDLTRRLLESEQQRKTVENELEQLRLHGGSGMGLTEKVLRTGLHFTRKLLSRVK